MEADLMLAREALRPKLFDALVALLKAAVPKDAAVPRSEAEVNTLVDQSAQQMLNDLVGAKTWYVGAQHGECSGDEDCVTRYYFAKVYEKIGAARAYYYISDQQEHIGFGLCAARDGTGINLSSRQPQSRYGDAVAGWGACGDWIVFNDAVPPDPEPK